MKVKIEPFLIPIRVHKDPRGSLSFMEDQEVPFKIKRVFWINDIPENTLRGGHAHRQSEQVLICIQGHIRITLENPLRQCFDFVLDSQNQALFIPPLLWGTFEFGADTQALALASDYFDEADYIRDYQEFNELRNGH